ncbi:MULTISPECIES: hypothetical protein [unclassified Streptomyces]|uniref:hypothetical protein n=1 Tax=unclassified Streptomyces TaxID=2593676 RepID=UPI00225C07AD|nr:MULTISPECIES: hypothetical protein [unclassified Streptomyces]MCX5052573.1 hypothetical protein [Streptomyces sp. NBC_00474]
MHIAKCLGGAVWIGSWYLMYLEITRWHHVKPSLAFNADPIPGTGVRPRPGQPLILLHLVCVAAPLVIVAGVVTQIRARRAVRTSRRPQRPACARPGPAPPSP